MEYHLPTMNPLIKSIKAIRYLGLPKLWYYTIYQIGLRSGHYRRVTPPHRVKNSGEPGLAPLTTTPKVPPSAIELAIREADEILRGYVRLFSGEPMPLELSAGSSSKHWSELAGTSIEGLPSGIPMKDIKFIWEPARFGWAITLARAYAFSGDPVYAQDFWDKSLYFLETHPPNLGWQWVSAQEVAIRLMVFIFCDRVFAKAPSSSPSNRKRLWESIAEHAQRIPPTLIYARAQNNNHLLSEAAGLYAAGLYLPDHPQSEDWRRVGWHWLNWGFQNQIDEFGTYIQHSTNYHRLMLQIALFADHIRREGGEPDWPLSTISRLDAATRWLWALCDSTTGGVPNLGANDGAYLFPLSSLPFSDYRPVVAAAGKAFLNQDIYNQPNLAEIAEWFSLPATSEIALKQPQAPDMLRVEGDHGRAFLHTAHYADRPSHADQLHVDLWWRGVNIALDPGSYSYNAVSPWDNALASTQVHNTLTLDDQDQMLRAGRFLWLDWAQAEILAYEMDERGILSRITAEHNGYRHLAASHQRRLKNIQGGWQITDIVLPYDKSDDKQHQARLTWLMPNWDWNLEKPHQLLVTGPDFAFRLTVQGAQQLNIFSAGDRLHGEMEPQPTWGWASPTYGAKQPALMVIALASAKLPIEFTSTWTLDVLHPQNKV